MLPLPNSGEGISTSTTITKNSPSSNKTGYEIDIRKPSSVWSEDNSSEFAIFKVEKVRRPLPGRSRVNSENNVFSVPVFNPTFEQESYQRLKNWNRKHSMNIEIEHPKIDLTNSPIKEPIKEQKFEDDEEEKFMANDPLEAHLVRHNTFEHKSHWELKQERIFIFEEDDNQEMNLDNPSDINMEIDNGPTSKYYSLDPQDEDLTSKKDDIRMDNEWEGFGSMDVDEEDNFNFFNQQPNHNGFLS